MYLISACLCGVNCKYNGKNNLNEKCLKLLKENRAILVCPEQLGGLKTPRNPSEIKNGSAKDILEGIKGKVVMNNGSDVTSNYVKGAMETLFIAKNINIEAAILKESSPSCGANFIYDGTFSNVKIKGMGITACLLKENNIKVISEKDLENLDL